MNRERQKRLREQRRRYRERHRETIKAAQLKAKLKKFDIGPYDLKWLLAEQGGGCGICGRKDVQLCIDHNHRTGFVRDLLCVSCNAGLGLFQDSERCLANAIDYLNGGCPLRVDDEASEANYFTSFA
jgi:Autographiviridae endonuclease VII